MIKSYISCVIITIFISFVLATPDETCDLQSNTSCTSCLSVTECAYCKDSKKCFSTDHIPHSLPCATSQLQVQTCFADSQTLLIGMSVAGGILLIVIIIIVCCLRSKCRECSLRKLERGERINEREMEERRAAAEIRSAERNEKYDQIRSKYGIPKGKESSGGYRRMS